MSKARASVGVRELKDHASEVLRRVRAGETIVVTDRNQPVAHIIPIDMHPEEEGARRLVAEGRLSWAGGKPRGAKQRAALQGAPVADAVVEDRR